MFHKPKGTYRNKRGKYVRPNKQRSRIAKKAAKIRLRHTPVYKRKKAALKGRKKRAKTNRRLYGHG